MVKYQAIVKAPGFNIGVCCTEDEVTLIDYLPVGPELAPRTPLAKEVVRQLRAYLKDGKFEFGLPLAPAGTPFQRKVWQQISAIPSGSVTTYGEVAKAVKSAPRAVGGACGANPYPIVVPCHRVIATGGALGGFANQRSGYLLDTKRWLLEHEQPFPQPPPQGRG